MEHYRSPEEAENLSWAEIAGLVRIHPDGSWEMTDQARERLKEYADLVQECPDHLPGSATTLRILRQ